MILCDYERFKSAINEISYFDIAAGEKWNRQLEQKSILMDVEGQSIHYFALTKNNLRYDFEYCPIKFKSKFQWILLCWSQDSNGVKIYQCTL